MSDMVETPPESLVIPCKPSEFGNFLSGLLKTPKTIRSRRAMGFEIDREGLIDVFHLIDQRIIDQQEATLTDFKVTLFYKNSHSVSFNTLPEFERYGEVVDEECTSVELSLVYLLAMPGSEIPQKQEISFTCRTEEFPMEDLGLLEGIPLRSLGLHRGGIDYEIRHTNTTWGYDLSNLLDQKRKTFKLTDKFHDFASGKLGVALCWVFGVVTFIFLSVWAIGLFFGAYFNNASSTLEVIQNGRLPIALYFSTAFLIIAVSFSTMCALFLNSMFDTRLPSSISVSERGLERSRKKKGTLRYRWPSLLGSVALSVAMGIGIGLATSGIWTSISE